MYMLRGSPFAHNNPSFDMISACIRLGHKYQMAQLLEHSIAYLKSYYPTSLETWQSNYTKAGTEHYIPKGFDNVHAIGVVNLARLTGELSILPTALLDCCMLDEAILDGFVRADGSREELLPSDIRRCLRVRPQLAAMSISIFARAFSPTVSVHCTTADSCLDDIHHALSILGANSDDVVHGDPFDPIDPPDGTQGGPLCRHCAARVIK